MDHIARCRSSVLAVIGIFAFITLAAVYFHAKKIVLPYTVSQHMDTASVSRFSRF